MAACRRARTIFTPFPGPGFTSCYDPANVNGNESNLKLMHHDAGSWVPVTDSLNVADNVICGTVAGIYFLRLEAGIFQVRRVVVTE